jgi:hypothetical protein
MYFSDTKIIDGKRAIWNGTEWVIPNFETDWESVAAKQAMTIQLMQVEIDKLIDAMTLAKIQGSKSDSTRILEEAIDQYNQGRNIRVSESPYGMTDPYSVKFWYSNEEGRYSQGEETVWANSDCAHEEIKKYCNMNLAKFYKNFKIINIIY